MRQPGIPDHHPTPPHKNAGRSTLAWPASRPCWSSCCTCCWSKTTMSARCCCQQPASWAPSGAAQLRPGSWCGQAAPTLTLAQPPSVLRSPRRSEKQRPAAQSTNARQLARAPAVDAPCDKHTDTLTHCLPCLCTPLATPLGDTACLFPLPPLLPSGVHLHAGPLQSGPDCPGGHPGKCGPGLGLCGARVHPAVPAAVPARHKPAPDLWHVPRAQLLGAVCPRTVEQLPGTHPAGEPVCLSGCEPGPVWGVCIQASVCVCVCVCVPHTHGVC